MIHTKNEIDHFLKQAFFAVLTYSSNDVLLSQLMIFAHTPDGEFYLISQNDKSLFESMKNETEVSVLIYKEEEKLDNIYQINVLGKALLIEGTENEKVKLGYELIGEKSPIIGQAYSSSLDEYSLIKVLADKISFITFEEIKRRVIPTFLKRI